MPPKKVPLLFADPCFQEHFTGTGHPESPERLKTVHEHLADRPVLKKFASGEFKPAEIEQLALVHDKKHIEHVRDVAAMGGGRIEADTVMSRRSFEIACRAAGAAIAAVDAVVTDVAPRALCLTRPPGHHALKDAPMGFCLFNNVAVAAMHALRRHGLRRVLIVDWDVHHGNGTQAIFYDAEAVCFFSAHRFPFYPGTGDTDETGTGAGVGTKFNLPVKLGTPRTEYLTRFKNMLGDAASRCRPELVLISAGFDAHKADPIGSLGLETEDFEPLTRAVAQVADQYCQGRIVSLLEGGYNVKMLAESVDCHMNVLAES